MEINHFSSHNIELANIIIIFYINQDNQPGAVPTDEEFSAIFSNDPAVTIDYESDVFPEGRKKLIHA